MKVNGIHYRTIWLKPGDNNVVQIIDQRKLPYKFEIEDLSSVADIIQAIKEMHLRGAPLIGAAAAYGMYFAMLEGANVSSFHNYLEKVTATLKAARPTAVNLCWAVDRQLATISSAGSMEERISATHAMANTIVEEDLKNCRSIGKHGMPLIEKISRNEKSKPVNILTHCNAGWLACVDYGTATAPIYAAFDKGIDVHVWVDETRPRNQGARLTAWELNEHGVPHTVISDNAGGYLMQKGLVDMVLVGSDRTSITGDVGNKIGTYLKALAAKDNNIPFYVGLPSSSIDWDIRDGLKEIPIEKRDSDEVKYVQGLYKDEIQNVRITPEKSPASNYAFDVTPSRLITGLITERGIAEANEKSLLTLFPELQSQLQSSLRLSFGAKRTPAPSN